MSRELVYLIGAPAAGKSTLMAELTARADRYGCSYPLPHQVLADPATGETLAVELGRQRLQFPGTDTLAMNISPAACAWLRGETAPQPAVVLAEGDRLAHRGFLDAAAAGGYMVTVAYLDAPPEVLTDRCAARGSAQNTSWRAGRGTKALRLAGYAAGAYTLIRLDSAALPPAALAARLRAAVPALQGFPLPVPAERARP